MTIIRLSEPQINDNELTYINDALKANEFNTYGDQIKKFELDLEQCLEKGFVAALISGTSAIHLALILAGVKEGDEVLCQTMTFAATVFPILYQKAMPIFIDSEKQSWNMSPTLLRKAIMDRQKKGRTPKAIIVVHTYGMPAMMEEIVSIANEFNIVLIEDAAEALGSKYKHQKCGTFGHYGILSFNGNKIITTSGGGALICKTKTEAEKAIQLATQSKDKAEHYQHSKIGYNYRMDNVSAAIGRAQIQTLEDKIKLRRKVNQFYKTVFSAIEHIEVFTEPNSKHYSNHWLSCICIKENSQGLTKAYLYNMLNKKNIETRSLWKPQHTQPIFKNNIFYGNGVSEHLFKTGLCLPSSASLTKDQKDIIAKTIHQSIRKLNI